MPLPCPKCGQYEVLALQPVCPGGCDLSDCWPQPGSAISVNDDVTTTASSVPAEEEAVPADTDPAPAESTPPAASQAVEHVPTTLPLEPSVPEAVPIAAVAEVVCPGCQATVHPEAQFCDCCGWPLIPHCPECGIDNRVGARFCRSCGMRLSGARPERRGRTRFCPTCGHQMTGTNTSRRTEAMPPPNPQRPRLPRVETPLPVHLPEPASEMPVATESPPSEAPAARETEAENELAAPTPVETPQPAAEAPVAAPPAVPEFELLVLRRDGAPAAAFPLKEGDNLVGVRSPGATTNLAVDLSPFDTRQVISRRHALFRIAGDRILLADCGSTNGTTVNDTPLVKKLIPVTEESVIEFAGLRCRIRLK